jgi:DUF917 family protein
MRGIPLLKKLTRQDLLDLVEGTAIFSAGGGGDPEVGRKIVEHLHKEGVEVRLVNPMEIPDDATIVNFACVGATSEVEYDSEAAVKTLQTLEEYVKKKVFAVIPVELGGFNTLAAVDVAARHGVPIVDADGAGRAVPEVHLKVYTIDKIPITPMAVADLHAKNIVIVKETFDSKAAERIARILAAEWNHSAYTARRILTGKQAKFSPILFTLSRCIAIGKLLREAEKPVETLLKETNGFKLFEGTVSKVNRETTAGFTWVRLSLEGIKDYEGQEFEMKAKNEVLAAYKNGKLAALAPDIITPIHPRTGRCITAEKIKKDDIITVVSLPAPQKWRTREGLELWKDVLQRSGIEEKYIPIEQLCI